jgi:hypothetical protein
MAPDQARQFVIDDVAVSRQQVVLMKSLLLKYYNDNPDAMLEAAVRKVGAQKPQIVVLHATVDPQPTLRQFTEWTSWWIAGCEALWGLVHSNVLIPAASGLNSFQPSISWTTVIPGSGGHSGGWSFEQFKISYPHWVWRPRASEPPAVLSDPDLFLNEIGIADIHPEMEEALRDAIRCFRSELYLPSLVMLGKASEGAWIELGVGLVGALPDAERAKHERQKVEWSGPDVGFAKKSRDILKFLESKQQHFKSISTAAGVRLEDLRLALLWSDAVREVRNVVHHGSDSAIPASYETASTLFLSAMLHLKTLYRLWSAATRTGGPIG